MVGIKKLTYVEVKRLCSSGLLFTHLDLEAELDVDKRKGPKMRFMSDFRRCVESLGVSPEDLTPSFKTRGVVYFLTPELYEKVKECLLKRRYDVKVALVGTPDGSFRKTTVRFKRW